MDRMATQDATTATTPFYSTTGISTGNGRDGMAEIEGADLKLKMALAGQGEGANPEQLFAMGYAACYHSALKFQGSKYKLSTKDSRVAATVQLVGNLDDGFTLVVRLEASLPALDRDQARELMEAAHQMCPYSRATRGNIPVELVVAETARITRPR
jgi:osmotically inducible protein OsmC